MSRPWQTLDRVDTTDGTLELRQRGPRDFLITLDGRVLMNSQANRSEIALAEQACAGLSQSGAAGDAPRLLIGGLGMGCTLRAALDRLPSRAHVHVSELNAAVAGWCRERLSELNGEALQDARVQLVLEDVSDRIASHAANPALPRFDAILLDLYEGPDPSGKAPDDPLYGRGALANSRRALAPGGILGVWCEAPAPAFERRLDAAGLRWERRRAGRGGRQHALYLARRPG